jgi:hypothetical protein
MEFDRQRFQHNPSFTQLFVSRSARLCKYVKEVVGVNSDRGGQSFLTFRELLYQLETTLPRSDKRMTFNPSARVDYYRFAREFYNKLESSKSLGALLVWKSKSCMWQLFCSLDDAYSVSLSSQLSKLSSKDQLKHFKPLSLLSKHYFISGSLGKSTCRLDPSQREHAYTMYL